MVLRIEKMASGALGIAHDGERTIIVSGALPGELVHARIVSEYKGYSEAEALEIIEPSPMRIKPRCPYYGICGGCSFQIVSEKDSAEIKAEIAKDNFKRIGGVDECPDIAVSYGPFSGHRHRVRFHADPIAKKWGFLGRRSSSIVPIEHCEALSERLNALLADGNLIMKRARDAIFSNRMKGGTGLVEISAFEGDDALSLGDERVSIDIAGIHYTLSGSVFFQSNPSLLPSLLEFVKENAVGDTIMDLYSGVGTFSALFEGSGKRVFAVERDKKCLALSRINAPSALSFTADVAKWNRREAVDTVIVDPPRVGLSKEALERISSFKPRRIIYVSCDSATMARDISRLEAWRIEKLASFDFYPGTGHDENAAVLSPRFD